MLSALALGGCSISIADLPLVGTPEDAPARSKQADEAVWELLGVSPGSGRTLDDGAFGVLWVGQGASFGIPVPGPVASSALNSAIESEVTVSGPRSSS